jgi:hypothetical protein
LDLRDGSAVGQAVSENCGVSLSCNRTHASCQNYRFVEFDPERDGKYFGRPFLRGVIGDLSREEIEGTD